jgi:hypothetical protein
MVAAPRRVKLTSNYRNILKFIVSKFGTFLVKFCTKLSEDIVVISVPDAIYCNCALQRTAAEIQVGYNINRYAMAVRLVH